MIKRLNADEEPQEYLHDIAKPVFDMKKAPADTRREEGVSGTTPATDIFLGKRPYVVRHDALPQRGRPNFFQGWLMYVGVTLVLFVAMLLITSSVFGRARVDITPYVVRGTIDTVMSAHEEVQDNGQGVRFETMSLERSLSKIVEADGVEESTSYASGTIVIYNKESTEQKFREETRFKTKAGLVYKLGKGSGVVVPPAVKGVPGSVEAVVYAEKAGPEYNGAEADLVIPGWEEIKDPRFATQYARSKTAFTGGAVGQRPRISPELLDATIVDAKKVVEEQLMAQATLEIPEGFVFFKELATVSFDEPRIEMIPDVVGQANVTLTARVHAYLFPEGELARALVDMLVPETENNTTRFAMGEQTELHITLSPQTEEQIKLAEAGADTVPTTQKSIRFRIQGKAELVSDVDADVLKKQLAEKTIKEVESVFAQVPEIGRASLSIRPLWRKHIPKNTEHIIITQKIEG